MTTLATAQEERFNDTKGIEIFFRSWRPASKPRAVIVICHGVNSHSGQYIWAAEQLAESLREEFPRITLPTLIMHGTADKATVCHGSEFFYKTAGSKDKTLKLYEGHYHDLLNDIGKEGVIADIKAWV